MRQKCLKNRNGAFASLHFVDSERDCSWHVDRTCIFNKGRELLAIGAERQACEPESLAFGRGEDSDGEEEKSEEQRRQSRQHHDRRVRRMVTPTDSLLKFSLAKFYSTVNKLFSL